MPTTLLSANLSGFSADPVDVEVDLTKGRAKFSIVGLADKTVEEARERLAAAVSNMDAKPPQHLNRSVTVNLAPADMKKRGTWFDLPIALAFLIASEQILPKDTTEEILAVGELGLDGSLRRVRGVLPAAALAKERDVTLLVPKENLEEAMLVEDVRILAADSLRELVDLLEAGEGIVGGSGAAPSAQDMRESDFDLGFIRGQETAKRALEIAAAGGHNIRMAGPPGSGKTLLARTIPTILPPLDHAAQLEVTGIWSVAGLLHEKQPLMVYPPFRAPHHSASRAALVGGGSGQVTPGEVTLAHRGVLFLDELPEFPRHVLEALRQPIEDGIVTVSRSEGTATYPARFLLVAAQNPCPCGHMTDSERECVCSAGEIERYKRRVSGPMMDRIDLHVDVPRITFDEFRDRDHTAEPSETVRKRTVSARERQIKRFSEKEYATNAEMPAKDVSDFCSTDEAGEKMLRSAHDTLKLSPRGITRILKTARTIADLAGSEEILSAHIAEAIQYRHETEE